MPWTRQRRHGELRLRLTDLPIAALESVLAFAAPRDIASALRTCRALSSLDPWHSAYVVRWGAPGVEPRASVGKMAYLLRDACELVSGSSALAKTRHGACQLALDKAAMERFGNAYEDEDDEDSEVERETPRYIAHPPDQSREKALRDVDSALAQSATSEASARALMATLTQGFYVLLDRTNNVGCELPCDWHVKRFVLASPRGNLVALYSTEMGTYQEDTYESRKWQLHATVVGVADEPRLAETMRGSLGLRGQQLLGWFDRLLLGGDPHMLIDPKAPAALPGCGESLCLVESKASVYPIFSQSIEPSPSPAAVSSLLESLGLDGGVVHADDLLLALLVISNMLPVDRAAEVWGAPPEDRRWEDVNDRVRMHPGVCLWRSCRSPASAERSDERLEWDGPPTRMTWAGAASS
jgi:hypothetical protein